MARPVTLFTGQWADLRFETARKKEYLQPKAAAEIVNLQLVGFVENNGPALAKDFKAEIPRLVARIPDLIVEQLPQIREGLEARLEDHLTAYCSETTKQLGNMFDEFLVGNKEAVKALVEAGQDPEGAKVLGQHLEIELRTYLRSTGPDGESIQQKLDSSLQELKRVDARLHRLAHAKDLTPQEKKLRHAIALITRAAQAEGSEVIITE